MCCECYMRTCVYHTLKSTTITTHVRPKSVVIVPRDPRYDARKISGDTPHRVRPPATSSTTGLSLSARARAASIILSIQSRPGWMAIVPLATSPMRHNLAHVCHMLKHSRLTGIESSEMTASSRDHARAHLSRKVMVPR